MVTRSAPSALLSLVVALVAGCNATALMDGNDDMSRANEVSGSTVPGQCSQCFDDACGWQRTECSGDPTCARWLGSAQSCGANGSSTPDETCLRAGMPSDTVGLAYATALETCVSNAVGCCGDSEVPPTGQADADAGPVWGTGGSGGASGAGGSDNNTGGNMQGGVGLCTGCDCETCLYAIKDGAADDQSCEDAVLACYGEGQAACWAFMGKYATCNAGVDVASPAACLVTLWAKPDLAAGRDAFTSEVLPCAAQYCAASCFPPSEATCVECQAKSCLDELAAVFGDVDAEAFGWCRQLCQGETSCIQGCAMEHPDGLQVFQVLAQCTATACTTACADW